MHMHRFGARAHKACGVWVLIAGLGFVTGVGPVLAQSPPGGPAAGADGAPSEAMRRQALSPYRFILQNASAPARKPAVAAPPAEAKRPVQPAAVEQAAVQPRAASPAPAAPQPASQPPAPEPVAAVAPKAAEPSPVAAVRREIIPVKTDEPRLSAALMRERPSGVVKISFDVMPDGSTNAVKVVSSTNRDLNRASVDAVSRWKFQPVDEVLAVETELAYKYD
ncbi:MAG: hypothetical protein JWQ07_507 [Ramlibacter sp.]|nr:hypothetical protein [Ramlibacter sp.]